MGPIKRGIKNAFRNVVRTSGAIIILSISVGLALIMLISYQTIKSRITEVKSSVGTNITINPAGAQGFQGGGEPLTIDQLNQVKTISHITDVNATLNDRLTPAADTNLASAIDPGTLGNRNGQQQQRQFGGSRFGSGNRTFTIPITVTASTDLKNLNLLSGSLFDANSTDTVAVVGSGLAVKNNLTPDSTFTAYGKTFKVSGIFDEGNQFANSGIYVPLATLQTLSNQANDLNSITVTIDSIDNIGATADAIKSKLGADKVDIITQQDQVSAEVAPLENVKKISLYSLIGAIIAGGAIMLLLMIMTVRERRKEIGVLKALGATNLSVMTQFVSEALSLTIVSSAVGTMLGFIFSNRILTSLISSTANNVTTQAARNAGRGAGFARVFQASGNIGQNLQNSIRNIHAAVGTSIFLYGFLAAIVIGILGSAVPAFLIAKVKPAEIMRTE